jgi:transposase-like protein
MWCVMVRASTKKYSFPLTGQVCFLAHKVLSHGFDERIVYLYSKGMATATIDVQAHFEDVYGVKVSASFISLK